MANTNKKLNPSKSTFRINTATSRSSKGMANSEEDQIELELTADNIELMESLSSTATTSGVSSNQRENKSNECQVRNGRASRHHRRSASSSSSSSSSSTSSSSSSDEEERPYYTDPRRERQRLTSVRKNTEKSRRQIRRKQRFDKYLRDKEEKKRSQRTSPSSRSSRSHHSSHDNQRKSESRKSPSNEQPQIIYVPVPQAGYSMGYNMSPHVMAPMQMPYLPAHNGFQPSMPPPHHFYGPMHPLQMAPPMRPMNVPFRASMRAPFRVRLPPRLFHHQRPFQRRMQ
ncbi:vitellogenin-like [Sitodiplosis mosellana]|uniref:vitellogenin-like n=1 Tax=Sitodiplosis mosellana TaxID=263140 RepID=UPI002444E870|nr:vitellogenin-like [Sitodiplosis mosellana]